MEGVRGILTTATIGSRLARERERAYARLRIALVVSLGGHLALATIWRVDLPESRPAGLSALSVEFRRATPAPPAAREFKQDPSPYANRQRVLTSLQASDATMEDDAMRRSEAPPRPSPFIAVAPSRRPADGAQPLEQVPGGDKNRRGDRPGEVAVVLVISDDDHAQRIIWNQLPAMSAEQFRRLESKLRSRAYPGRAGQAISEYVDVLALLRGDVPEPMVARSPIRTTPPGAADPR